MKLCDFGCGKPAIKTFKNGKHCCSNATSACPTQKLKNSSGVLAAREGKGNSYWKNGHPKGSSGGTSLKGKTHKEIYGEEAAETRRVNSIKRGQELGGPCANMTDEQKEEHRQRASLQAYARHAAGWDNKAGRCKKYHYSSPIAGDVTLDGTWELAVAQWLDKNRKIWKRNKQRFPYIHMNGSHKNYTPDFWVEGIGFIEVKGYETDLDRCKWSQFPEPLTVWKKSRIIEILTDLKSS